MILRTGILLFLTAMAVPTKPIKHRFIALDESGGQILYVNEFDPSKDWTLDVRGNRGIQKLDDKRILVNTPLGYREIDIATGKTLKDVKAPLKGCFAVYRFTDGHTYLTNRKDMVELDENDKVVKKYPGFVNGNFRALYMNPKGNFLLVTGKTTIAEVDRDGKTVRGLDLKALVPKVNKCYEVKVLPDGNYLVSTGSGVEVVLLTPDWKLIRKVGGAEATPGVKMCYFAGAALLPNGNIIVTHWSGHKKKDSEKAAQALEYDKDNKLVWKWHDPKRAGCFHGIIVLE